MDKKVMLLGIALILLGSACNLAPASYSGWLGWLEWLTAFVGKYAHWIGILLTILGLFEPRDDR